MIDGPVSLSKKKCPIWSHSHASQNYSQKIKRIKIEGSIHFRYEAWKRSRNTVDFLKFEEMQEWNVLKNAAWRVYHINYIGTFFTEHMTQDTKHFAILLDKIKVRKLSQEIGKKRRSLRRKTSTTKITHWPPSIFLPEADKTFVCFGLSF